MQNKFSVQLQMTGHRTDGNRGPGQMTPDGSRAFVALAQEGAVVAIDLKTLTVSSRLQTGPGADGMAWVR
jgi:hypothetical protein